MRGNNGSEQKSRGRESKQGSDLGHPAWGADHLQFLNAEPKSLGSSRSLVPSQNPLLTNNGTNESKQGSSDEQSQLEQSLISTLGDLSLELDNNTASSLKEKYYEHKINELISALINFREDNQILQEQIADVLHRTFEVILNNNIYGAELNKIFKQLNDDFYDLFYEKKHKIKSLIDNDSCRGKYAICLWYVMELNKYLIDLLKQVPNINSTVENKTIDDIFDKCDKWLERLIFVIKNVMENVKQERLRLDPEVTNSTSSAESILSKGEDIKKSLQSLRKGINGIAGHKYQFNTRWNALQKSKYSLAKIENEYNQLKKTMSHVRPNILENLKLYVEFGVPEELASIDPVKENEKLFRELTKLEEELASIDPVKENEKLFRELTKLEEDSPKNKGSSSEKIKNLLSIVNPEIELLELHEGIKQNKSLKESIEKGYDEFERYYKVHAEVLSDEDGILFNRHQQLHNWSTKKRKSTRESIIEGIKTQAREACKELEIDTEKNLHREKSPFGILNSTHAEKMKKLEQYCSEMKKRCEQINTLRDEKIEQLPELPTIEHIRPIELIKHRLDEKRNYLEGQVEDVLQLQEGIDSLISQIEDSNSDEELSSVSPSSQLECKSSSASERLINTGIKKKKLKWKNQMGEVLASLRQDLVDLNKPQPGEYKVNFVKTKHLESALDKLGVKSKSKSKKYKTSILNKKQPEAKKRNEAPLPRNDSANSNPELRAEIKADRGESDEVSILERPRSFGSIDRQLLESNQNEPEWPAPVYNIMAVEKEEMIQAQDVSPHHLQWLENKLRERAKGKRKLKRRIAVIDPSDYKARMEVESEMRKSERSIEANLKTLKGKVNEIKNTVDEINEVIKEFHAHEEHEIFLSNLERNLTDFMTESEYILNPRPDPVEQDIPSIPSKLTALQEKYQETLQFLKSEEICATESQEVSRLEELCGYASCNYFFDLGCGVNRTKILDKNKRTKILDKNKIQQARFLFKEMFLKIVDFADSTWISNKKQALEELCFNHCFSELEQICIGSIENMLEAISTNKNKCESILQYPLTKLERYALKVFAEKKFKHDLVIILVAYVNKEQGSIDINAKAKKQAAVEFIRALNKHEACVIENSEKQTLSKSSIFKATLFSTPLNRFGQILTLVDWYQENLFDYLHDTQIDEDPIQEQKSSMSTIPLVE